MCSNAIPAQCKTVAETQSQFDEVCNYFKLPSTLAGPEKLAQLPKTSSDDLVAAIKESTPYFRPVTDGIFIHAGMIDYLKSPEFAQRFKRCDFKLLIGEVLNEQTMYSIYNAPERHKKSLQQLQKGFCNTTAYPNLLTRMNGGRLMVTSLPMGQVHAPSRSVANSLFEAGVAIKDIWRCQIAYRLSFLDEKVAPLSFGVAHATDKPLWNFAIIHGRTPKEKAMTEAWVGIFVAFVNDDHTYHFGTTSIQSVSERGIEIQEDARWEELLELSHILLGTDASTWVSGWL